MVGLVHRIVLLTFTLIVISRSITGNKPTSKFDPYVDNGGTVVGIAGNNYCILASDTRLSDKYMIRTRSITRLFEVADGLVLSGSGCWSDIVQLSKVVRLNCNSYEWNSKKKLTVIALAHLLAYILYDRRMFPYFSFSALGGLDSNGCGALFRYDAIGSYERVNALCSGKGEQMIQPILDNITNMDEDNSLWKVSAGGDHFESASSSSLQHCINDLTVNDACNIIVKSFKAAAEREISIGDGIELWIIKKEKKKKPRKFFFFIDKNTDSSSNNSSDGSADTEDIYEMIIEKRFFSLPTH